MNEFKDNYDDLKNNLNSENSKLISFLIYGIILGRIIEKYKKLRNAHKNLNFDEIDYCKDCDFLVDDPEVLVYNSVPDFKIRQMLSTTVTL